MILQHHLQFVVLLLSQHLRSLSAGVEHPVVTVFVISKCIGMCISNSNI